jgi:L-lactate dehydrogenase complex protein LldF
MKINEKVFRRTARETIGDPRLKAAYEFAMAHNREIRAETTAKVPDIEDMRDEFKQLRAATVANLAHYLQQFEENAQQAGADVHWAQNQEDVGRIVLEIARRESAKLAVKSKSMLTEEVHLNEILEDAGLDVVETDLGEYIIQLAGEKPSHIIAPAVHQTAETVADLFAQKLGKRASSDPQNLTALARQTLRKIFLEADIGISGANFGVAETGSVVLVTNEGNGRMVTSLPRVHIAVMGIERVAPDWHAAALWISLLARFATGQPISIYTSVVTGPAREEDPDGPEQVHIILLDNNRTALTGTQYEEVLECIRCGSCLSVCPVYLSSGGHAYHSPYSGPIGAVISPLLFGKQAYKALPNASTLCGACLEVCPVRIDLPRMLLALRADHVREGLVPPVERFAEQTAARMFETPRWMRFFFSLGRLGQLFLRLFNIRFNQFDRYPLVARKPFREIWAQQAKEDDDDSQG